MSKLVEIIGTSIYNVTVPATGDEHEAYKTLKAAEAGITEFRVEDDSVRVAPGWTYDSETHQYSEPT